jgi:hypothetical protein
MKRRKFLTIAGIGGLLAGFASFRLVTTTSEDAIEKIILNELSFLNLDKEGVRHFVADYTKSMTSRSKRILKGYSFMGITSQQSRKINSLMNAYLLSTDFFIHKMDETRIVKYVGLYDPHIRACAHPFTYAYYPRS